MSKEKERQKVDNMTAIHTESPAIFGGMNVNEAELKMHQIQTVTTLLQQVTHYIYHTGKYHALCVIERFISFCPMSHGGNRSIW